MRAALTITASAALTFGAALVAGFPFAFAVTLGFAAAAAFCDALWQRIPNTLSALAWVSALWTFVQAGAPAGALVAAACLAAVLWALWEQDLMGGGDVKLIPALALAVAAMGGLVPAAIFFALLIGIAAAWGAYAGLREAPLVVGGPLAMAAALIL